MRRSRFHAGLWSALVVAVLACVSSMRGPFVRAGERFRRGDVNLDATFDIADPVKLLFHLFRGDTQPGCPDAADANDDGELDTSDAIASLSVLFLGDPPLPFPGAGPCPGVDLTADTLGCPEGEDESQRPPILEFWPEYSPRPASRIRQGTRLPTPGPGVYRIGGGRSFAIVVDTIPNLIDPDAIELEDPSRPGLGNPAALRIVCDGDLGRPDQGGVAAGTNLARRFLTDIDIQEDPLLLTRTATLRIAGDGPLAPDPGVYRFLAVIHDPDCESSEVLSWDLEVLASREPEIDIWLEDSVAGVPSGQPRDANPATGGLRLGTDEAAFLVVSARPNGSSARAEGEIDPETLEVTSDFALAAGPAGPGVDLADRFAFHGLGDGGMARWTLALDAAGGFPTSGNVRVDVGLASRSGDLGRSSRVLEVEVSYSAEIQPLWNRDCSGCHEEPLPNKNLELVNLAQGPSRLRKNIVNLFAAEPALTSIAPFLVWPHRPARSYLRHKLAGTQNGPGVEGSGGQMPLGGPPFLSADELRSVESWIAQGAADN